MKKYEPHRFPKRQTRQKTKVEIFYKKHEVPFLSDLYEKITKFKGEETGIPKILEKVYRERNIVDGSKDERAYRLKVRSMSVGDFVKIKGKTFRVNDVGWSKIKKLRD